MTTLAARRRYGVTALGLGVTVSFVAFAVSTTSLRDTSFVSGWVLLTLIATLMLLNARKKLPFLPIGSAATWLQVHIYVGLFSVVAFGIHVEFRVPNGILESVLAMLFGGVVVSGVVGLWLARAIPKRLATLDEQVLFERQPRLRRKLRHELREVIDGAASPSLTDFYARRLIGFFAQPRHLWHHLVQSKRPEHDLLTELDALGRYLTADERAIQKQVVLLIRKKSELDHQHAHHTVLRYWLFLHIPVSYSLLIVGMVHAALAYAFRAGM